MYLNYQKKNQMIFQNGENNDKVRQATISLKYNGKNVNDEITQCFSSMTYTDVASGETDTISIVLIDEKNKWINGWFPVEGDYVESEINQLNWTRTDDNKKLNCGKFLIDDYDFQGPPDIFNLKGIASPINSDFTSTTNNKTWNKTTIKSIASNLAKKAGITLVFDAVDYSLEKVEQSNQSDMSFLFSLCSSYGFAMKLYNSKLILFNEEMYEKKAAKGTIDKTDCSGYGLNGTLVGIYHGVSINYTDAKTNKTLSYSYKPIKGNRILKLNEKAESLKDAELKAKSNLRKANKAAKTITLELKGNIKYLAGTCYNITGFGKFNGKYYIDKAIHSFNNGYTVSLQMHKVLDY